MELNETKSTGYELSDLEANSELAAETLKALAHKTRLMILCHIGDDERTVHELEEMLHAGQSNVSQHLAKLRTQNILQHRKEGNQVFYRVKDPAILDLVVQLQRIFC